MVERYTKKEVNNQKQGKSGAKVDIKRGPVGKQSGNPTKSGGIFRPTKGSN
jgi:hypothetical protein